MNATALRSGGQVQALAGGMTVAEGCGGSRRHTRKVVAMTNDLKRQGFQSHMTAIREQLVAVLKLAAGDPAWHETSLDDIRTAFGEWIECCDRGDACEKHHERFAMKLSHYILRAIGIAEINRDGVYVIVEGSFDPQFGYETLLVRWK